LESGLDAVVVERGRLLRRRPDAYANSGSYAYAGANSYADAESGHGMQRDSDLDRDRDLYRRTARKLERLHL
jgi:hypothetical protein